MKLRDVTFEPVWFDSMGAKSMCCSVETPDLTLCLDPGVAGMQPSYPIPDILKRSYASEGRNRIRRALEEADLVSLSHYHYDHLLTEPDVYDDVELWIKDPNRWINKSQWGRARDFLRDVAAHRNADVEEIEPEQEEFADPYEGLESARRKDFGEYQERREELLRTWRERFENLTDHWASERWIAEPTFLDYADGREIDRGDTTIRFEGPLFHGIEYSRTGWVFATVVETPETKFVHSSDLEGPTIEDYADWIIQEDPDILVLDGPATYLLGFLLNTINLGRAVDNAARILETVDPHLMIWDHHLLRETAFRSRTEAVWELREEGYAVKTAAEVLGEEPLVDRCQRWDDERIEELTDRAEAELDRDAPR